MWERALLANCLKTLLSLLILPGSGRPPSRSAAGPHRSWIPAAHHRWASFCCAPSCAWSTLASPPRIAKSLGLFAHSVRVFYAAEREDCRPGPGMVPHEWNCSLAGKLPQSDAPPAKQAPTGTLPPSQASSHPQAPAEPAHNSRPYFFFRACSNRAAIVPVWRLFAAAASKSFFWRSAYWV